jgi:hypothetical protein
MIDHMRRHIAASLLQALICALVILLLWLATWTACGMSERCSRHNKPPEAYATIMRGILP